MNLKIIGNMNYRIMKNIITIEVLERTINIQEIIYGGIMIVIAKGKR